jgi:hypothetical protein
LSVCKLKFLYVQMQLCWSTALVRFLWVRILVTLFYAPFHLVQAIFGLLVLVLLISGVYCVWKYGQCRHKGWVIACIAMLALGFTLWNIDVHFCPSLRKARQHMFLGKGDFITQFHSWWHLLAGLGAYLHVLSSSRLRMEVLGYRTDIKTCLGLPYLTVLRRIDLWVPIRWNWTHLPISEIILNIYRQLSAHAMKLKSLFKDNVVLKFLRIILLLFLSMYWLFT